MGVYVGSRRNVRVSQPFLDLLKGKALLQQNGGDRVTQIMKADARQCRPAAHTLEFTRVLVRPQGGAVLIAADIAGFAVLLAQPPAVGFLPAAQVTQVPAQRIRKRQGTVA